VSVASSAIRMASGTSLYDERNHSQCPSYLSQLQLSDIKNGM